jgi:hypothetical protein
MAGEEYILNVRYKTKNCRRRGCEGSKMRRVEKDKEPYEKTEARKENDGELEMGWKEE